MFPFPVELRRFLDTQHAEPERLKKAGAMVIATRSGTPVRTRFLTVVRRKSCGMRPGHPAARHAAIPCLP